MNSVSIGIQDYAWLRENDIFYIDKTGFIRDWWETKYTATLIVRPRRFGKTLNMSMLYYFFQINTKEDMMLYYIMKMIILNVLIKKV
ncbi:MAG: AAA family ATPase [Lachnospiraceae bacterium]|nr:AAA family ATPase [Lachnospiraceae bacterium]